MMSVRGHSDRVKRAVQDSIENIGRKNPKSKRQIFLDAGYSPSTAHNTNIIERGKAWRELMDEYLPDELLAQKHAELLEKIDERTGQVETAAVKAALELAYRIKNKLTDAPNANRVLVINFDPAFSQREKIHNVEYVEKEKEKEKEDDGLVVF